MADFSKFLELESDESKIIIALSAMLLGKKGELVILPGSLHREIYMEVFKDLSSISSDVRLSYLANFLRSKSALSKQLVEQIFKDKADCFETLDEAELIKAFSKYLD